MHYNMEECGMRIAKLRNQHGYTQEQFSNVLNIDRSILSRAEVGKRRLSIEVYVQISALFDVSLDYLLVGRIRRSDSEKMMRSVDGLISQLRDFKASL